MASSSLRLEAMVVHAACESPVNRKSPTGSSRPSILSTSAPSVASSDRLRSALLDHDDDWPMATILFGWWPTSASWTRLTLIEQCTRCLPAVHPGLDVVALPDLPEVKELWEAWSTEQGLKKDQAIWFAPHLEEAESEDPALKVCQEVLDSSQVRRRSSNLRFYPMCLTDSIAYEAVGRGVTVIGDPEILGSVPLTSAKEWLHPRIDSTERDEYCVQDLLPPDSRGVRPPRGYVATSVAGLKDAWKRLHEECKAGTRFVLKPASGGGKVLINADWDSLGEFDFATCESAILEEQVLGRTTLQSPTLYMIGNNPCGRLADQVFVDNGAAKVGDRYPSRMPADLLAVCANAAQRLNNVWGITGSWSLDFVIGARGDPMIVDINVGNPTGTFAVRLWASRQSPDLSIQTGSWVVATSSDPGIEQIYSTLREEKLLWNGREGVLIYEHIPGLVSSFAVASCFGEGAVGSLLRSLSKLMRERFGVNTIAAA